MQRHDFHELVRGFRVTLTAFAMQATYGYLFFSSWLLGDHL